MSSTTRAAFASAVPRIEHVLHSRCLSDVADGASKVVASLNESIRHLASEKPIDTYDKYENIHMGRPEAGHLNWEA